VNIAFRLDASVKIGSGHFVRCLTLATELKQHGVYIRFVSRHMPKHLCEMLDENGHEYRLLSTREIETISSNVTYASLLGVSQQTDAQDTIDVLSDILWDWIVVDHYALNAQWHQMLRDYTKYIFVIDDLADRPLDCDLLLDQSYGRREKAYTDLVTKQCRMLLGSRFALLRSEFVKLRFNAIERRTHFQGILNILVAMGGTDPENATKIALKALAEINWQVLPHIDVVLGSNAPFVNEIQQLANYHLLEVTVSTDVDDMAERMVKADIAIGAGGCSSWERCCLGLPTLVTVTAENQKLVARNLEESGAVKLIGIVQPLQKREIKIELERLIKLNDCLSSMSKKAFKITDGLGTKRIVMELAPPYSKEGKPIRLRPINIEDTDLIYKWQSDPRTRQYSHNTSSPSYNKHVKWIKNRVEDNLSITDIIMYCDEPAGVVRLDPIDDINIKHAAYMISIYVSPEKYRLGLAKNVLYMVDQIMEHAELRAEVNEGNIASHALFTCAGFIQQDDPGLFVRNSLA